MSGQINATVSLQDKPQNKTQQTTKLRQKVDFTAKNIFVGMDVHQKSWNVSIFPDRTFVRSFTQTPSTIAIARLLKRDDPGANYLCGYESGYSGFWIQRDLHRQGIQCQGIQAADIAQTAKQKLMKRDPVDSKKIGEALSSQNKCTSSCQTLLSHS